MDLYREAGAPTRARFGDARTEAESYFRRYVAFVARHAARDAAVVDVGCGTGWSTLFLREHGFDAVGIDLHDDDLDVDVPYRRASAERLPFDDRSVGTVCMHQVLEHLIDPEAALLECGRVLRPAGKLLVVGPNLISFPLAMSSVARNAFAWRRGPDLPRHPYGNTLPEAVAGAKRAAAETMRGLVTTVPRFVRREPDHRPPFHADNDATWYANPTTVLRFARRHEFEPVTWWAPDRRAARLWWPFAAGTWGVLERVGGSAR